MNIELIMGVLGIVGAAVAIVLPILKRPHEMRNIDAAAAQAYAQAAKLASERAEKACDELDKYKERISNELVSLRTRVDELEELVRTREQEVADLKDWAERLVHQVKSYGGEPVPYKPRKKST
jgi:ElaB/YqjD/DUF883 family membrane-anchored ribosome-binding protein